MMILKNNLIVIIAATPVILAYLLALTTITNGATIAEEDTNNTKPQCLGVDFPDTMKDIGKLANNCMMEAQKNNKTLGKICGEVCKMKKMGILNKDGKPSMAKYNETVAKMLPADAVKRVFAKPLTCFGNDYANLTLMAEDEANDCKNYQPFVKCVWTSVMSVCEENFDDKGEWD